METLVGQAPIAIEQLLKSPSVTCLDPVVLELHLLDLELAHEDGEDGVEGDEQGDQVPWFLISFLSRSVTILNNDFIYCLV